MIHPRFGEITDQPPALTTGEKKEHARWNAPKREGGMNANGFEMYPKMLYRAQQNPLSGKFQACLDRDVISADKTVVILSKEQFDASCQLIVGNAQEHERARAVGWRDSQAEAMAFHEGELDRLAQAAAERNYDDRRMSAAAQREIAEAEQATEKHLAEVKEKRRISLATARAAKAAKKVSESAPTA